MNEAYRFQRARALSEMGLPDHLCEVCRQRMDAVLWAASRHPGCGSSPPISDRAEAQLIRHLATILGAVEIESTSSEEIAMTQPRTSNRKDTTR